MAARKKYLTVEMELENDAFVVHENLEIASILRELADKIENNCLGFDCGDRLPLGDSNGNMVGWAVFSQKRKK